MAAGRRLRIWSVVFMDELQNLVLFMPDLDRRVGVYDRPERVPSVTLAMTEGELALCLEAVTDRFARTVQTREGRDKLSAAREAIEDMERARRSRNAGRH